MRLSLTALRQPAKYNPDFAFSLHQHAFYLGELDRHDEALPYSPKAVELRRKLVKEDPVRYNPHWQTLALRCHSTNMLIISESSIDMMMPSLTSVELCQKLAEERPMRCDPDLATSSLRQHAHYLEKLNQRDEALFCSHNAVEPCQELTEDKPIQT